MTWTDEANSMLEELLRALPAPSRGEVEEEARVLAESTASDRGESEVSMETAIHAFVEATPADLRERLKHTLTYHGVDPEEYAEAFDS